MPCVVGNNSGNSMLVCCDYVRTCVCVRLRVTRVQRIVKLCTLVSRLILGSEESVEPQTVYVLRCGTLGWNYSILNLCLCARDEHQVVYVVAEWIQNVLVTLCTDSGSGSVGNCTLSIYLHVCVCRWINYCFILNTFVPTSSHAPARSLPYHFPWPREQASIRTSFAIVNREVLWVQGK